LQNRLETSAEKSKPESLVQINIISNWHKLNINVAIRYKYKRKVQNKCLFEAQQISNTRLLMLTLLVFKCHWISYQKII